MQQTSFLAFHAGISRDISLLDSKNSDDVIIAQVYARQAAEHTPLKEIPAVIGAIDQKLVELSKIGGANATAIAESLDEAKQTLQMRLTSGDSKFGTTTETGNADHRLDGGAGMPEAAAVAARETLGDTTRAAAA